MVDKVSCPACQHAVPNGRAHSGSGGKLAGHKPCARVTCVPFMGCLKAIPLVPGMCMLYCTDEALPCKLKQSCIQLHTPWYHLINVMVLTEYAFENNVAVASNEPVICMYPYHLFIMTK